MNRIGLLIIKDVKLALQGASDTGMTFVFLLLACTLFQFSIGPDQTLLIKVGGGVIWVVALLATILSLERLFITDFEDGTLEQYFLSPMSLVFFALAKAISHWLTTGLLVIISAPIISPVLGLVNLGPYPPKGGLGDEVHLKTLYLISPASHSASSGWISTFTAFLKPASSKAAFHANTPSFI